MSKKHKLYYKYDPENGEPWIIDSHLENLMEMIKHRMEEIENGESEELRVNITFVWLTDDEFAALPDAY